MILHDYWRSSAAYRVRIALNLKRVAYRAVAHDLRIGAQGTADYAALNPQRMVPAIAWEGEAGGVVLTQSLAILEWLEERHPAPPLLPVDKTGRAIVRAMAATIACDVHPLHNLRVLTALRSEFGADDAQVAAWMARWMGDGLAALEVMAARHGEGFAYGDAPGFADICLVPQIYSAERFGIDLGPYPTLVAAANRARALPAFEAAHPSRQPDADPQ
ncbi:maleylacetoacetate isomerase [Sphingomonas abietis]|uniref:Maleylacetoacetate isomerase n=1 Tax=Sphingomonas abietis TaxID=3012344 RepID=A0ABY7NLL7_9SPHN|nr:maleylacetoacetate isomerase [Sphingomonas abietis]WBO22248.1 maleylacetoacetate isomerase [Sphingomonas abietis]